MGLQSLVSGLDSQHGHTRVHKACSEIGAILAQPQVQGLRAFTAIRRDAEALNAECMELTACHADTIITRCCIRISNLSASFEVT